MTCTKNLGYESGNVSFFLIHHLNTRPAQTLLLQSLISCFWFFQKLQGLTQSSFWNTRCRGTWRVDILFCSCLSSPQGGAVEQQACTALGRGGPYSSLSAVPAVMFCSQAPEYAPLVHVQMLFPQMRPWAAPTSFRVLSLNHPPPRLPCFSW